MYLCGFFNSRISEQLFLPSGSCFIYFFTLKQLFFYLSTCLLSIWGSPGLHPRSKQVSIHKLSLGKSCLGIKLDTSEKTKPLVLHRVNDTVGPIIPFPSQCFIAPSAPIKKYRQGRYTYYIL